MNDNSRSIYPEFYLLSDEHFADLGAAVNAKDCSKVNKLLKQFDFDIQKLNFSENKIVSVNGKNSFMELNSPVEFNENCFATTLKNVEIEARNTIKANIVKAVEILDSASCAQQAQQTAGSDSCDSSAVDEIYKKLLTSDFTHSVILTALQVDSTKHIEEAIKGKQLETALNCWKTCLDKIIKDNEMDQKLRNNIIILSIHDIKVIKHLIQHNVEDVNSWLWRANLRHYFENGQVTVRQGDFEVAYGNNFLDNTDRLVITPLTIRAYMNHMAGICLRKPFCATGPAGTGKTETVKDLAKNLGYKTFVLNCSDQMDTDLFTEFLPKVAELPALMCWDEFNRIPLEVVKVAGKSFEDVMKNNNKSQLSVAYTCNPGYAGRVKLPEEFEDNHIRIKMHVPDRQTIIEAMLATQGFLTWENNAEYIARLLQDCELYLSKQPYYDFGLRCIKSIIKTAGCLLKNCSDSKTEADAIKNSILFTIAARSTKSDIECLTKMVNNFYPNQSNFNLMSKSDIFVHTLGIRHAVLAYGPENEAVKFARSAAEKDGYNIFEVNYFSGCLESFYGAFTVNNETWKDGSFTSLIRQTSNSDEKNLILVTGVEHLGSPGTAIMMEQLNMLFDDNKKLCLANNELLALGKNTRVCIAGGNCDHWSPASVSRVGVVSIE